jgi:hypothetical protein
MSLDLLGLIASFTFPTSPELVEAIPVILALIVIEGLCSHQWR